MRQKLAQILAFVGAAICVVIPLLFAFNQGGQLFPMPGLYFLEIALFGLIGLASVIGETFPIPQRRLAPWVAAGMLLAFNVLGIWTIGLFLLPGTISFLGAGFLSMSDSSPPILQGLGWFLLAAIVQAALILALVQFF
ncbi:MAG TPA: hypothetical protein VI451_14110 [Anaerolineales bacterium]|nr:hypothetical protein [Anaerolineales bacterium]